MLSAFFELLGLRILLTKAKVILITLYLLAPVGINPVVNHSHKVPLYSKKYYKVMQWLLPLSTLYNCQNVVGTQ